MPVSTSWPMNTYFCREVWVWKERSPKTGNLQGAVLLSMQEAVSDWSGFDRMLCSSESFLEGQLQREDVALHLWETVGLDQEGTFQG